MRLFNAKLTTLKVNFFNAIDSRVPEFMVNDLILPVPVLLINRRAALPEPLLRNILKDMGYPQELIMSGQTLDAAEKLMIQHLPNLIFYSAFERADLNFIKTIKHCCPSSHLVTFHQAAQTELIAAALQAGADAYLLDGASAEAALQQMKSILRGGAALHPQFARRLLQEAFNSTGSTAVKPFSPAEQQILQLISQSSTAEQAAARLKLSVYQVNGLIRNIFRKLAARSPSA